MLVSEELSNERKKETRMIRSLSSILADRQYCRHPVLIMSLVRLRREVHFFFGPSYLKPD